MCYKSPGPRCSASALKRLQAAEQKFSNYNDEVQYEARESEYQRAKLDYDATPGGQSYHRKKVEKGLDSTGEHRERMKNGKELRKKQLAAILSKDQGDVSNDNNHDAKSRKNPESLLAHSKPELSLQWHPALNGDLTPHTVTRGSDKKVWWRCSTYPDHTWRELVKNRAVKGYGCPICSGKKVFKGFNDLASQNEILSSQWDTEANKALNEGFKAKTGMDLSPDNIVCQSNLSVYWVCPRNSNHRWKAPIKNRSLGRDCAKCSGNALDTGVGDLETTDPELSAEWHEKKNGNLKPSQVFPFSHKTVWWRGKCGHEWQTEVAHRSRGTGCPKCPAGVTERKMREKFSEVSKNGFESSKIELFRKSRKGNKAQVDMINHDLKLVIEYDGAYTHGGEGISKKKFGSGALKQRLFEDKETTQALVDAGYRVVRIREHDSREKLPLVPLDKGYAENVFQIPYTSHGKEKDSIDEIVEKVMSERSSWFK